MQLVARRREDEATGPFTWRVVNPLGGIRTFEGIRVNVPFEREVSSSVDFENGTAGAIISALGVAGSTHQIFLNDDTVGTIRTFRNEKPTFDFTGRGFQLLLERVEDFFNILGSQFNDSEVSLQALRGRIGFTFGWEECLTNNLSGFTVVVTGGFNPLLALEGTISTPLSTVIAAASGSFAAVTLRVVRRVEELTGATLELQLVPSGSVAATAAVGRDACGQVTGVARLEGQIGMEVRLVGGIDEIAELRFAGSSRLTTQAQADLTSENRQFRNFQVGWSGIQGAVTLVVSDDFIGGFSFLPRVEGETNLLQGQLIDPRIIVDPVTIPISF